MTILYVLDVCRLLYVHKVDVRKLLYVPHVSRSEKKKWVMYSSYILHRCCDCEHFHSTLTQSSMKMLTITTVMKYVAAACYSLLFLKLPNLWYVSILIVVLTHMHGAQNIDKVLCQRSTRSPINEVMNNLKVTKIWNSRSQVTWQANICHSFRTKPEINRGQEACKATASIQVQQTNKVMLAVPMQAISP